jgi:hypothetical protein
MSHPEPRVERCGAAGVREHEAGSKVPGPTPLPNPEQGVRDAAACEMMLGMRVPGPVARPVRRRTSATAMSTPAAPMS